MKQTLSGTKGFSVKVFCGQKMGLKANRSWIVLAVLSCSGKCPHSSGQGIFLSSDGKTVSEEWILAELIRLIL